MKKGKMKVLKRQVCKRKLLQKWLEIEQVHWTSPQREIYGINMVFADNEVYH